MKTNGGDQSYCLIFLIIINYYIKYDNRPITIAHKIQFYTICQYYIIYFISRLSFLYSFDYIFHSIRCI